MTGEDPGGDKKRDPQIVPLWLQAIFTGVITIATIVYACIASRQAEISRDQARIAERQAEISIAVQRPWVLFDPVPEIAPVYKDTDEIKDIGHVEVRLRYRNYGNGPALNVEPIVRASVVRDPDEIPTPEPLPTYCRPDMKDTGLDRPNLPPNAEGPPAENPTIIPWERALKPGEIVYVRGLLGYKDQFDCFRWTFACWYWDFSRQGDAVHFCPHDNKVN